MDRPRQTAFDYVVAAISPALIITLIGSLVFFLTAVFYRGEFQTRLLFILAMFSMGTVLIARLAITGSPYALLFGVVLAIASGLAMMKFVEIRGFAGLSWLFNLSMLALVWWCAHKLTYNCTLIDENEDASGEGLLQSFGWDKPEEEEAKPSSSGKSSSPPIDEASKATVVTAPANASKKRSKRNADHASAGQAGETNWEQQARAKKKRRRAPGAWVVFFSLAALPIFGIGQGRISDLATRRFAFWMLCIYVLSGLGLMLTTSLLGLRRYLRQRMLEMPVEMTGAWLAVGAMLVLALLAAVWIIPRPSPEYSISDVSFLSSRDDLRSSRYSVGDEPAPDSQSGDRAAGTGDESQKSEVGGQKSGGQQSGGQQSGGQQSGGQQSDGQQSGGQQSGGQESGGQQSGGQQSGGQQSGGQQSGGQQSGGQQSGGQQSGGQQSGGQQSGGQQSGGQQSGSQQAGGQRTSEQQADGAENNGSQSGEQRSQGQEGGGQASQGAGNQRQGGERSGSWFRDGGNSNQDSQQQDSDEERQAPSQQNNSSAPPLSGLASGLSSVFVTLLKALYYLVFLAIALYAMWRYRRQLVAGFRALLANLRGLWGRLFGRKSAAPIAPEPEAIVIASRPFADFSDPFVSGAAGRWSPEELVRYSFLALEAWARERGCERRPEQTPHEFADALGAKANDLSPHASSLADLYSRVAYARGPLPTTAADIIRRLWLQLRPA